MQNEKQSLLSRLEGWQKLLVVVVAILGSAWSALMYFNPIGKVDLTVRIEREIPISLPTNVGSLPLRLMYEGTDVKRASTVEVEVLNSGSTIIGGETQKWRLDLKSTDGSTVVPLGPLRPSPPNVEVTILKSSPKIVTLEIGLFNPKDSIRLGLMLVNPVNTVGLPVVGETRIPGLSQPVTTRQNIRERLRDRFIPPIAVVVFVIFLGGILFEERERWEEHSACQTVKSVAGMIWVSLFVALLSGSAISWVIAWFAADVLSK